MKKLLSIILTLGLLMTSVTMNVATPTASAATVDVENYEYYTTLDISGYYNVKQYLSAGTAGTIAEDETLGTYDFFKEPETNGKTIPPYAISKEAMDEFITDGIATFEGVPFKVSTPDNAKGAYKRGGSITVPAGYYKQIKLLTVAAPETIGNNYLYPSVKSAVSTEAKSLGEIKTGMPVGKVDLAKVYETDNITDDSGNIKQSAIDVVTLTIPEGYEELKSFNVTTLAGGNRRIIGATLVGLKGEEWNTVIAEKIAALPEKSAITESNYAAVEEITAIIKLAKKDGADTSVIEGIEKYNEIKTYVDVMSELYTKVDISSKFNAKVFLSTETAGTLESGSVVAPDFFVAKKSDGTFTHPRALSKNGIDSLKVNDIMTLGGIPYDVKTLDNEPSAFYTNPSGNITVPTGYYSKIKILYTNGVESTGDNTFYTSCKFADDTSGSLVNGVAKYLKSVSWTKVYADDTLPTSGANLMEQSYEPSDKTKELKSINIYSQAGNYKRVLAVTLVGLQGDEYAPLIASKIAALPEADAITTSNFAAISEVEKLIEKAAVTGADLTAIEGIEKYNAIVDRRDEILALYIPVDISERFNAVSFLAPSQAGTVTDAAIPDYFMGTAVTSETAMALNRDKVSEFTDGGLLKHNGIPYYMPLPVDGKDSYSYQQGGALSIPAGNYEEIRFLIVSADGKGAERGKIHNAFNYTDGTKQSGTAIVPNKHDSTVTTDLVLQAGIVNATAVGTSEDGGKIYEYVLKNPYPEKIVNKISLSKGGNENSGTRILAVTVKNVEVDEFGEGIENCELSYENDDITINVLFEEAVEEGKLTKENIVLTCDEGAIPYTLTSVKENDVVMGVKIQLENALSTADNYQLGITIEGLCDFETTYMIPKPVTLENVLLKNSSQEVVDRPMDITDGKLTFTADVKNNTYTEGKAVNIITAVYNGNTLYGAHITPTTIAKDGTYPLNVTMDIPTSDLTESWTAKTFVWDVDMITPLVK